METSNPVIICATERDIATDRWIYLLSNGKIECGRPGASRIPCGLPFNEKIQWGANQVKRNEQ